MYNISINILIEKYIVFKGNTVTFMSIIVLAESHCQRVNRISFTNMTIFLSYLLYDPRVNVTFRRMGNGFLSHPLY